MSARSLNVLLALALLAVWGAILALRPDPSRRGLSFMPEMALSLTHEAQGEWRGHWPGAGEGAPPEGSIPVGHPPLFYRPGKEEAARAGRELKNPAKPDEAALARGAAVFSHFCAVCHGPGGLGDGPVTKSGMPAPPSLLGDSARRMADGRIFHIITFGQGNMPGHAAQLERADRWKAVLHVRTLQGAGRKKIEAKSAPAAAGKSPGGEAK